MLLEVLLNFPKCTKYHIISMDNDNEINNLVCWIKYLLGGSRHSSCQDLRVLSHQTTLQANYVCIRPKDYDPFRGAVISSSNQSPIDLPIYYLCYS